MITLNWVTEDDLLTEVDYWSCAIPDDKVDKFIRDTIKIHNKEKNDRVVLFNNRLVLLGFRYYVKLKYISHEDVVVKINNKILKLTKNGHIFTSPDLHEMKFYEQYYDKGDLADKYLSELVWVDLRNI